MKQLLLSLLFLFATSALAATVEYKDQDITIQLYDGPCVSKKILDMTGPVPGANAAKVSFKDKVLEACWILDVDHIDLIDENGEVAENVSPAIFKVVPAL
jgi:hypothetical protein